jgi:transposase
MQGIRDTQPKLFYSVSLDRLVPPDNLYRKIAQTVDFRFLYRATQKYYGTEGPPSIDPVVFLKMCLVGYLNNIISDRKLVAFCSNCLDVRWFLGYDIDEELPWHSTISRTRQLYGEDVFLALFKQILSLCVEKGMVRGKRQAIDSAFVKANASLDSLVEKEILDDAETYADELNEGSEFKVTVEKKVLVEKHHAWKKKAYKDMPGHSAAAKRERLEAVNSEETDEFGNRVRGKYLSNHTHYSPTDPDAKISVKPGKARQMNYFGQIAVDDANHVITCAMADFADQRDSQCLEKVVAQTKENLADNQLQLEQVLADAGYSSGEALAYLDKENIDAWMPNFGQYIPHREGFVHNKEMNQYECVKEGGNRAILRYKGERMDSKGYTKRTYRSSESDCRKCPLREQCCGRATNFKKIDDSIYKEHYDRMHKKLTENPEKARRMSKIRSKTVEPVLGTLLNFLGMKRVNTRGISGANKHVVMSALTYNLKKLLKRNRKTAVGKAVELGKPKNQQNGADLGRFWHGNLVFEVRTFFELKNPILKMALAWIGNGQKEDRIFG